MDFNQGEIDQVEGSRDQTQDQPDAGPTQTTNSIFPPPPIAYKLFTRDNVARYTILKQAKEQDVQSGEFDWDNADPAARIDRQKMHLERVAEERAKSKEEEHERESGSKGTTIPTLLPCPSWDILLAMEPPRIDWITEKTHYTCFGEPWPVEDELASLEEMGMLQIYPSVPQSEMDRPAILTSLLRTLLKSYLSLVDTIMAPPQEYLATQNDPNTGMIVNQQWVFTTQDKARQINDLSINFMHLLNETRPLQAQEQLRDLMKSQLEKRKEETNLIRLQCEAMRKEIQTIKDGMKAKQ